MTVREIVKALSLAGAHLQRDGGELSITSDLPELEPALLAAIRQHKASLLRLVDLSADGIYVPTVITPDQLSLVTLTPDEIETVVSGIPGGAANIQDIYPLTPLQEGMLFHHQLDPDGDGHFLPLVFSIETAALVERMLVAISGVIQRHDILRTALVWEGLDSPVQVVLRSATPQIHRIAASPGAHLECVRRECAFPSHRLDLRKAPLLHISIVGDGLSDGYHLIVTFSHLSVDHAALEVFIDEVRAFLDGTDATLAVPYPFRNFVAATRSPARTAEYQRFFKTMLGDISQPTLPFGLGRVRNDHGALHETRKMLDPGLSSGIRAKARRFGVSASSVFHLAWAYVLARNLSMDEVVFGTVLFGNMQSVHEGRRMFGLFINTLPICVDTGERNLERALRATHVTLARLIQHEHASLVLAQQCSGTPADMPLFSSLLNYRHTDPAVADGIGYLVVPGIRVSHFEDKTNYPLTLSVDDYGQEFALTVQIQTSHDVNRVFDMYFTALRSVIDALDNPTENSSAAIDILPSAERRRVLQEFNATYADVPLNRPVHRLFEARAAENPGAFAVCFAQNRITYQQLDRSANRLALRLQGAGVGHGSVVAICLGRSPLMVVAILATLKAGAAYLPLDALYPRDRLAYMLSDAAPCVILTQHSLAERIPATDIVSLILDSADDSGAAAADRFEATACAPDDVAYLIYTSGSTGSPKGVRVPHRALSNCLWAFERSPGLSANDVMFATTTLCFDIAALELLLPLAVGAECVIASEETVRDMHLLQRALQQMRPTVMQATPTAWQMLFESGWRNPEGIRLWCGGEALPETLQAHIVRSGSQAWNLYGPSETTIWSTCGRVTSEDVTAIGKPIANTQIYILDGQQRLLPIGATGEIYIGGRGVALGYLNRESLTDECFVQDPFSATPGAKMYRTGDLARWRPDGVIQYLGRNDTQVKIRGFRVELGEVEVRLASNPLVRAAAVVARDLEDAAGQLVAYVVLNAAMADVDTTGGAAVNLLRGDLERYLPAFMIPNRFEVLQQMPVTFNGKIDRNALPAPARNSPGLTPADALLSSTEHVVAEIWRQLLDIDAAGLDAHANFFVLGGHSLLATRFVNAIRYKLGIALPLRLVFENPSIRPLAKAIDNYCNEESRAPGNAIDVILARIRQIKGASADTVSHQPDGMVP